MKKKKKLGANASIGLKPRVMTKTALQREAQQAVFDAAQLGAPCENLDAAARAVMARHGLGPDYALPGLPHRAGHGLGLEIHEGPYIVRGNTQDHHLSHIIGN